MLIVYEVLKIKLACYKGLIDGDPRNGPIFTSQTRIKSAVIFGSSSLSRIFVNWRNRVRFGTKLATALTTNDPRPHAEIQGRHFTALGCKPAPPDGNAVKHGREKESDKNAT